MVFIVARPSKKRAIVLESSSGRVQVDSPLCAVLLCTHGRRDDAEERKTSLCLIISFDCAQPMLDMKATAGHICGLTAPRAGN